MKYYTQVLQELCLQKVFRLAREKGFGFGKFMKDLEGTSAPGATTGFGHNRDEVKPVFLTQPLSVKMSFYTRTQFAAE